MQELTGQYIFYYTVHLGTVKYTTFVEYFSSN